MPEGNDDGGIRISSRVVPMNHRQPRHRRAEIGDAIAFERTDVGRAQIRATEGNAGHPWSDTLTCRKQDIFGHVIIEELLLERIDSPGITLVQQYAQITFGRQHEELIRVNHGSPQISGLIGTFSFGAALLAAWIMSKVGRRSFAA